MQESFDAEAIRAQLQRITDCCDFAASQRSKKLLGFLVEEALAGRGNRLKGFYIACECLGRDADFDPLTDPIVRIEMGKLRRALELYYLGVGSSDLLQIVLPKGNYQPLFESKAKIHAPEVEDSVPRSEIALLNRASICIPPLSGAEAATDFAEGLRQQIAAQLNRLDDVYVLIPGDKTDYFGTRFTLLGQVRMHADQARIGIQLVDNLTRAQCWASTTTGSLADPFALEDRLALDIVNQIADPHHGEILRALVNGGNQASSPDALVARFNTEHLRRLWDAEWQQATRDELRRLLDRMPDFAPAHAALARAYNDAYLNGQLEIDTMQAALYHAQRAVELVPDSPHAYSALANARKALNDKEGALLAIEHTLALSPLGNSMHAMAGIKLISLGEVERGEALVREYLDQCGQKNTAVYLGLALLHLMREETDAAIAAISRYLLPDSFWSLLLKTACMARASQIKSAQITLGKLLILCPDFARRPRRYLEAALSSPDWIEQLLADLLLAGLVAPKTDQLN